MLCVCRAVSLFVAHFLSALLIWLVQGSQDSPPPHKCVCKYEAYHIAELCDKHYQVSQQRAELS